jgi:Na+/glutamate symporter
MLLIWVGWMVYEMVNAIGIESPTAIGFYCGAGVGVMIGGLIGARINRKVVRKANEILSQIEELQRS